jgi:hypothetical protein
MIGVELEKSKDTRIDQNVMSNLLTNLEEK